MFLSIFSCSYDFLTLSNQVRKVTVSVCQYAAGCNEWQWVKHEWLNNSYRQTAGLEQVYNEYNIPDIMQNVKTKEIIDDMQQH